MNYKFLIISIISIVAHGTCLRVSGEDENKDSLLSLPSSGEARPAWWFDVWFRKGILILGTLEESGEDSQNKIEVQKIENGETSKFRLEPRKIRISSVLHVDIDENYSTSDMFLEGNLIDVFILYQYNEKANSWSPTAELKDGKSHVMLIDHVGAVCPGEFFVRWVLDESKRDQMHKIIEASQSPKTK